MCFAHFTHALECSDCNQLVCRFCVERHFAEWDAKQASCAACGSTNFKYTDAEQTTAGGPEVDIRQKWKEAKDIENRKHKKFKYP